MTILGENPKSLGGRKKIEIERIESKPARDTCFSKRRQGLFKKAAELVRLTGAQVVIIVFSPGGRAFCFGHPSVDGVIDRYLDPSHHLKAKGGCTLGSIDTTIVSTLDRRYVGNTWHLVNSMIIKTLVNELGDLEEAGDTWLIENMGLEMLERVKKAMEELRAACIVRIEKLEVQEGSRRAPVGNQFLAMMGDLHTIIPREVLASDW